MIDRRHRAARRDAAGRRPATRSSARAGSPGSSPAELAERIRDAAVRLRPRRHRPPGGGAAGRPAARRRARLRGQGEPGAGRRRRISAGSGLGADVASGGELATVAPGRDRAGPGRDDRPGQARRRAAGRGRRPAIRAVTVESPGELARLEAIAARGRPRPAGLLRAAVSEHARLERVRLVGDDGAGKFGMDAAGPGRVGGPRGRVAASRAAGTARLRRLERPRRRGARRARRGDRAQAARRLALRCGDRGSG